MPVVGLLPLWAYMYARGLEPPSKTLSGPVGQGQVLFASKCSSCHGTQGEGGVGYPLAGGEVEKSFDKIADQITFVYTGNKPYVGKPYGTGRHIGGQKGAPGAMPAWGEEAGGELSDAEILAVVCYERYGLGGGDVDVAGVPRLLRARRAQLRHRGRRWLRRRQHPHQAERLARWRAPPRVVPTSTSSSSAAARPAPPPATGWPRPATRSRSSSARPSRARRPAATA